MPVATLSRAKVDAQLLEACRSGDPEALRALFEACKDRVYRLAFHLTGDEAAAWDLTQEAFVKLFSSIREFRGDAKFETWLYRTVTNACIDELRKRKRFVPLEGEGGVEHLAADCLLEESYIRRQVAKAVQAAVARLKPALRLTIILRYVEGLSYGEIGETLGCPTGTVAARLNRGHKILARELAALRGVVR